MKVTRGDVKFEPVTLVLETQAEVDLLVILSAPTNQVLFKELALKMGYNETYFVEPDLPFMLYSALDSFASDDNLGSLATRFLNYSIYKTA